MLCCVDRVDGWVGWWQAFSTAFMLYLQILHSTNLYMNHSNNNVDCKARYHSTAIRVLSTNQRVVKGTVGRRSSREGPKLPPPLKCNKVTLLATRWRSHSVQCRCWGTNDTHIKATGKGGVHYDWSIYEC